MTGSELFALILHGDSATAQELQAVARAEGYQSVIAGAPADLEGASAQRAFDVVILQRGGPLEAAADRELQARWPRAELVTLGGDGHDTTLEPFFEIPAGTHAPILLAQVLRRARERIQLLQEHRSLLTALEEGPERGEALGVWQRGRARLHRWSRRLAGTLDLAELQPILVRGLSSMTGRRPAVFFAAGDEPGTFRRVAVYPEIELPEETVVVLDVDALAAEGLGALQSGWSRVVVDPLRANLGVLPRRVYPLTLGRELHGLLVSLESELAGEDVAPSILEQFLSQVQAVLANAVVHRRLEEMRLRDGLTRLYNHRYFQERLEAEVSRAGRYLHPLSLIVLDVDQFKAFNETHGYAAGDRALQDMATALFARRAAGEESGAPRGRLSDVAVRVSGKQFALILPETPGEGARIKAERLHQSVASARFSGTGPDPVSLTVSVGVATLMGETGTAQSLLARALDAVDEAKAAGGDCVVVSD